ncbi:hypothetical protein KO495_14580 [Colwellia sp. D2M02]|uniref:Uncharacterized protein n=1 Tax=Colwellia asteriadis TaxID=517723 RepID=A0ABP3WKX9_9GAMM|nr:hypothetical protein [Colwellia sp. D2M02]MBU2894533.1 hypothetical protein [Colwellia sp. D2M02]
MSLLALGILFLIGFCSSGFYYYHSLCAGMPRKRWAIGGFILGPVLWPMFSMKKRMVLNHYYSVAGGYLSVARFRA